MQMPSSTHQPISFSRRPFGPLEQVPSVGDDFGQITFHAAWIEFARLERLLFCTLRFRGGLEAFFGRV